MKMFHRLNFTKNLYLLAVVTHIVILLTQPYAYKEQAPVRLFILFVIPHIVISIVFAKKFEGDLQLFDNKNFLSITFIFHFIPTIYYYMLRSAFRPAIFMNALCIGAIALAFGALYLDSSLMSYTKKYLYINKNKDNR